MTVRHRRSAGIHAWRGCIPEWGRDCGYGRVSGPLAGDVKGAQVRCASVSDHERLRAFTSIYERLRAFASAPGRVWSRLVAFSRVWSRQFFFLVSGHVWACSVISCHIVSYLVVIFRHFLVISRHSRPKFFFPGMAGNGRLRLRLGREGSSLLRMVAAPGAGCASCHDIRFKLVCNCGRAAAVFVYVQHNCTAKSGSLQLLGIPGCISV